MRRTLLISVLVTLFCMPGVADTRVIVLNHTDGFSVGAQETPPKDEEYVYWIGENRLQVDQADFTFIVRGNMGVLLFVDHVDVEMNSMCEEFEKLAFVTGNYVEESKKIEGFTIAGSGLMSIPAANVGGVGLNWFTKQIDELEPPMGTYIPPAGYVHKPFDFGAMFSRVQ